MPTPEEILAIRAACRTNGGLFFREFLGADCEDYQTGILRAIVEHDRVAISACHDVGKSWTLARVVLWLATCFPYSKIITTAPTGRQVEKILWSEIRAAYRQSRVPLGGRMLTTEWKITEEGDWFALGFSPSNEAANGEGQGTQSTFQGFHASGEGMVVVVFDEATGVKPALWTMAEGLLTSANVKFICIGNPTSTQSDFYKCFSNRAWKKIKLSCFNSPNLLVNGITNSAQLLAEVDFCRTLTDDEFSQRMKSYKVLKPYLLTLRWVVEKALEWGVDSALFLSKCLGEFPEEGDNVAIPLRVVEEAQRRIEDAPRALLPGQRKTIGVDVARFGADSTVITRMDGWRVTKKKVLNKRDTTQVVGEIIALCQEDMPDVIVIDETGLGAGVVDMLNEARNEGVRIFARVEIRGVQFGAGFDGDTVAGAKLKEKYVNAKARMFDLLAQDMRSRIALFDEEVYLAELPAIQYRYDSKGRMEIESKDQFKKRTGRSSPDHADSLALANFGHYDELTVGSFSTGTTKTTEARPAQLRSQPMAGSLKGKARW